MSRGDLEPYDVALRHTLRAPLRVQRRVEAVVASGRLRPAALALLGRAPWAMGTLIGVTGDMTPVGALLRSGLWADIFRSQRQAGRKAEEENAR